MGLTYSYEFTAPAAATAAELKAFLKEAQKIAESLGFAPATVLAATFDTPERRDFSRHLGGSFFVEDDRLKGVVIPAAGQVRDHNPLSGECRLIPTEGVVLILTDERGCESPFGFLKYPEQIVDIHGAVLAQSGLQGRWSFRDFINSPDPRFRTIVNLFVKAGFAKNVEDEFA